MRKGPKGGAGVVILEAMFVEWAAKHRTFGMGVSEDKYIPGLAAVAEGIKEHGALAMAQINHNGRLLSEDATGLQTVAASTFVNPATGEVSLEFSTEEVQRMVDKYAAAAVRVQKAGFDGVEIHGAHGYLLAQFLSPFTNKRSDEYGGSLENRMRLPLQIVRRVRRLCGDDFIISYRISADEYFQGGLTKDESVLVARELEKAGVDMLDVTGSSLEGPAKLAKVIPCYYLPVASICHPPRP
jgi:2,4-dienoyl-CoA reductase-like NADH-dependent reductase (Old Yellow Enzyme family)